MPTPDDLTAGTKSLEDVTSSLNELQERANAAVKQAEENPAETEQMKTLINEDIMPQVRQLTEDRDRAIQREEFKAMQGQLGSLTEVINALKESPGEFTLPNGDVDTGLDEEGKALASDPYASGGSYFNDVRLANKGNAASIERLTKGLNSANLTEEGKVSEEGKAMTEGVNAQGGYLVRPLVERRLVEAIELNNVVRSLCSSINVTTNAIQLDQIGLSTTAGWVAELAQKPETTNVTLATVTASVFTAAGLATISNQLLSDSNPAADTLATRDLAKRLVALEETAFLTGTGTNQPLGLLNTPGLGATALTGTTVDALLDAVLDSLAKVETVHGAPTAILMHPRTWTRILKSKNAQGAYHISPGNGVQDPRTGLRGPSKTLWGYPVVTSNRVPTNLGAGTNESRVIIGDYGEALILDRAGITVDESRHVYFTTNQTVFRAEKRLGFTAARTPTAFDVIGGAGMASG